MVDYKFRKALDELGKDLECEIVVLDNASYDYSVAGITEDGRLIYDYDTMIEEFAQDNNCDYSEAREWIDYNTLRAIGYFGERSPIIMHMKRLNIIDMYGTEEDSEDLPNKYHYCTVNHSTDIYISKIM